MKSINEKAYFYLTRFIFILGLALISQQAWAGKTTARSGIWIMNSSCDIVHAQIDGKSETVCLPKVEFTDDVDIEVLYRKLKGGIARQEAVFQLYHDGYGTPVRVGNMLFASDVYLKDMKKTFIGVLQNIGYKFKLSDKPAFEDSEYLRDVQAGRYLSASKRKGTIPVISSDKSPSDQQGGNTGTGNRSNSTGSVETISDILPAGVLPPAMRKMKQELDAKLREIKNRPYKVEIIKVDTVRWASGRMGKLTNDGLIADGIIEGTKLNFQIQSPIEKDWLKSVKAETLISQPCEYILQRDLNGREFQKNGRYFLADLYFTDLGLTWSDWLVSQGVTPASYVIDSGFATGPITLSKSVLNGKWRGLKAPVIGVVAFDEPVDGMEKEEIVRVPPLEDKIKDFKDFAKRLDSKTANKVVNVSLLICPDGKPYLELGQKRVARIYFPDLKSTLLMLMEQAFQK